MRLSEDEPAVDPGPELSAELRRLANLFLLSSVTLVLFLMRVAYLALSVTFLSHTVVVVWGGLLMAGWTMTYVLSLYTTFRARRWRWLAVCAIPFTCVPAGVAYAWFRRGEIENEVLGERSR
jgi:hypothetical protein